jgi:hypothetical protein
MEGAEGSLQLFRNIDGVEGWLISNAHGTRHAVTKWVLYLRESFVSINPSLEPLTSPFKVPSTC